MGNIAVRTLSGSVFISMILLPLFLKNELITATVFFFFLLLGLIEFSRMFKHAEVISINKNVQFIFSISISILLLMRVYGECVNCSALILPLVFSWFMVELFRKKKHPIANIGVSLFGFVFICLPFIIALQLQHEYQRDFPLLAGMFILIWSNDTFAFLAGKFFGKTKLFERISPKKTWEGLIGGFVFALLFAVVISFLFDSNQMVFWIVSVFVIVPAAIFGDLIESLLKRSLNIKDSGNMIPGHGGILDRFDASFFAIPFFYAWVVIYFNF